MQRINISEKDLTTSIVEFTLQDRVFIPGFAVNKESEDYIGIAVECDTLDDFYYYFRGEKDITTKEYFIPVFAMNQPYPTYAEATSESAVIPGFRSEAIPKATDNSSDEGVHMFKANATDPSYLYAEMLLKAGMPVTYLRMNSKTYTYKEDSSSTTGWKRQFPSDYDVTVVNAYKQLEQLVFNTSKTDEAPTYVSPIISPSDVDIKFITSGGYPTFEYHTATTENGIMSLMLNVAYRRGDCVALIDHTDNSGRDLVGESSVFSKLNNYMTSEWLTLLPYASMFTPWVAADTNIAPSITYLSALTASNIYNKNWLAVAGVNRGQVSVGSLHTARTLTNTIAEYYQRYNTDGDESISINPITYIKSAGYCIWGNRTLTKASGTTTQGYATQFLNIRNLISDVKKQARVAAQNCLFEQNNDILWVNFKEGITPLLDRMVSGTVLKGYKIIKGETTDKQKIVADIRIYPIYSVESFDITLTITDEDEVTTAE